MRMTLYLWGTYVVLYNIYNIYKNEVDEGLAYVSQVQLARLGLLHLLLPLLPPLHCRRQHSVDVAAVAEEDKRLHVLVVVPGLLGPPSFS